MTTIKGITISKMTINFLKNYFYDKEFNKIDEKDLESFFNNDLLSFNSKNKSLILNELSEIYQMLTN